MIALFFNSLALATSFCTAFTCRPCSTKLSLTMQCCHEGMTWPLTRQTPSQSPPNRPPSNSTLRSKVAMTRLRLTMRTKTDLLSSTLQVFQQLLHGPLTSRQLRHRVLRSRSHQYSARLVLSSSTSVKNLAISPYLTTSPQLGHRHLSCGSPTITYTSFIPFGSKYTPFL